MKQIGNIYLNGIKIKKYYIFQKVEYILLIGGIMKTKVVYVKSTFPSDIDSVFKLLTDVKTLQYIASPYASFKIIGEDKELVWKEGQTFSFLFKMFCFIPYGTHTIKVINFNKDGIYTNESNTNVPIWNHRIKLIDNGNGTTDYSDEVEIGAGWKTFIVWLWANCFYKHRQRKWLKLIKTRKVVK